MQPIIEPLCDTWTWYNDLNSWGISVPWKRKDMSIEAINTWCYNSFNKTLEVFSNLARVWQVTIVPEPSFDVDVLKTEWYCENSYSQYINDVLKSIREFPATIYEIRADIDLFVYVHTPFSPNKPVRAWIRLSNNELAITSPQISSAGLCLTIGYSLFGPGNKEYGPLTGLYPEPEEDFEVILDNNELQLLNQPLLEQALRKWEENFGVIDYVDGIPGIYKYGFLVEPY